MVSHADVTIVNKKGLHARAAAKFVKVVASYPAQVSVSKITPADEPDMPEVGGTSILGLMMLGADAGSVLRINAEGEQAADVIKALTELIGNRFGEAE